MRTWRQGALGTITISDSEKIYLKCLKYPLGLFYLEEIDVNSANQPIAFSLFVGLSVFPFIERNGVIKLSKIEKEINKNFQMDFEKGIISINYDSDVDFKYPNTSISDIDRIKNEFNLL